MMSIGKQIKYYRLRKMARQEDLADFLGVSCQAVSKWETEASLPDIALLPRLAVYLGVTIDELFRLSDEDQLERIENALHMDAETDDCTFNHHLEFLEGLTADAAQRARAHGLIAELYNDRAARDHKRARTHAEQAVALEPDNHDAWSALIEAYGGACGDEWWDNHFELIEYCKRFLKRHPENFRCLYALIENLIADGRLDEAEECLAPLERVPGREYMAESYRGEICMGRGDADGALAHWNRAMEIRPGAWQAVCDRADGLKKLGRYEEALADYERCFLMQTPPRICDGLYSRAQLFEQIGRYGSAAAEYQRILEFLRDELDCPEGRHVDELRQEIRRLQRLEQE